MDYKNQSLVIQELKETTDYDKRQIETIQKELGNLKEELHDTRSQLDETIKISTKKELLLMETIDKLNIEISEQEKEERDLLEKITSKVERRRKKGNNFE